MSTHRVGTIVGLLAFAPAFAFGCATTQKGGERIVMDPILVRSAPDPLTGLDGYDAGQLFELGRKEMEAHAFDRAIKVFEELVRSFPESDRVPPARFEIAVAWEHLEETAKALEIFSSVIEEYPGTSSGRDAHFRRCIVLGKLGRWQEVADGFWRIRQLEALSTMEELEARVGQGVAMFMLNDSATAEAELRSALRFHEEHREEEYLPAEYWIAQARFYLGEIYAREFEAKALSAPELEDDAWVKVVGDELEEKCQLLLRAQNNFIRAIRVGHSGWATASGYRIGSLYERLYDDLLKVPVPPSLTNEAGEVYLADLRERVGVLIVKAIKVYELSLETAQRVGERNEWVERTERSLERMKGLYLEALKAES